MRKRLEALKKDQKGFTLVELIVVLVILAILAALLVPALLGYIDKAKEAKYYEEARSIYTALQVINDERYASNTDPIGTTTVDGTSKELTPSEIDEIQNMISPTKFTSLGAIGYKTATVGAGTKSTTHQKYTIDSLTITFKSQDSNDMTLKMEDGTWSK